MTHDSPENDSNSLSLFSKAWIESQQEVQGTSVLLDYLNYNMLKDWYEMFAQWHQSFNLVETYHKESIHS